MFLLRIECDAPKCPAHWQTAGWDGDGQPCCTSPTPNGGMFVIDTSWISLPEGWSFGVKEGVFCPVHGGPER